ncbi:Cna B-type domain-containing protein [Peptostreptococcus faecalis]|uniref:Cna B-type domain-containing protein n=1 Tax=Peptostreptococcus faecalis TaxID=2045015 RepID=UPI000C7CCABC|nr:Cna B-type domain-containing protein [Peptostreptococcus faecalis]
MNKKSIISLVLCISMLFQAIGVSFSVSAAEQENVSQYVTKNGEFKLLKEGSTEKVNIWDENGNQTEKISVGDSIFFEYNWSVSPENMENIRSGTYFNVKLPSQDYITIPHFNGELKDSQGDIIGTYDVVNNEIIVTFSDAVNEKSEIVNGFFNFSGIVSKGGDNIYIGEKDSEEIVINIEEKETPPGPVDPEKGPSEEKMKDEELPFKKVGKQEGNNNMLSWNMTVNYRELYNLVSNNPVVDVTPKSNVLLEDILPEGVNVNYPVSGSEFPTYSLLVPVFAPTPEGEMSGYAATYLQKKMEIKTPSEGQSYEDFKEIIRKSQVPTMGIFENKVLIGFGNLPGNGDTYYGLAGSKAEFENTIDHKVEIGHITKDQADRMKEVYGPNGPTGGKVLGYSATVYTVVTGDSGTYRNDATLEWDNNSEENAGIDIKFVKHEAGVDTNTRIDVQALKVWNDSDNKYEKRPTGINIQLFADGEKEGEVINLNESNNWQYKWENLYKYRQDGSKEIIKYEVKEVDVPLGYNQ